MVRSVAEGARACIGPNVEDEDDLVFLVKFGGLECLSKEGSVFFSDTDAGFGRDVVILAALTCRWVMGATLRRRRASPNEVG